MEKIDRRGFLKRIGVLAGAWALGNSGLEVLAEGYRVSDFSKDSDEVLLARMLFGEARNCSDMEKIAVAYTAINRANDGKKWNGESVRGAILKPWQYSCFNENDSNRDKLMNPEKYDKQAFARCLDIARDVLAGKYKDPTGATHYFNPETAKPKWADKIRRLGRIKVDNEGNLSKHEFYRED